MRRACVVWTCVVLMVSLTGVLGAQQPAPEKTMSEPGAQATPAPSAKSKPTAKAEGVPYTPPPKIKSWSELVEYWMTPRPIPKSSIVRLDKTHCYPHPAIPFKMEIVREDEDTVWVRGLPPEDPESPLHKQWVDRQKEQIDLRTRLDWVAEHGEPNFFLDFEAPIVPPPFMDALTFEATSSKLPRSGLWQMSFAVADMNEDGIPDLVFPPARKGKARPWIFLGQKGGEFQYWEGNTFTGEVPYDYGGVAVADFDGDGHQDIVLGIHFKGQYVLYGDGAGHFERSIRLPSPDPRVTSRAPAVADFDGDGRPDVAFLAELDMDMGTSQRIQGTPTLWVVRNGASGWRLATKDLPEGVIGDNLMAADVDGDGRSDLVLASNTSGWRRLVYYNRGEAGWQGPYSRGVLSNAYHYDVGLAHENGRPELYATFVQFAMVDNQNDVREGLIRYVIGDDGTLTAPHGALLVDDNRSDPLVRLGVGDLDGDGRTDVVTGRSDGGLEVYLQNAAGELVREVSPELETVGRPYDIQLRDLDGDGRADIIASFADGAGSVPGGVHVWLTRPRTK